MTKKLISMVLSVMMLVGIFTTTAFALPTVDKSQMTASAISAVGTVYVNDEVLVIPDGYGYFWVDANGRTQAPVRALVEAMGYNISYDKGVVTVPGGPSGDLKIIIGSDKITVGGSEVVMDTIGAMIDERTYVPLRYVAEALGATVDAKATANGLTIRITTTFTPEKTINGVLNVPTAELKNVHAVLDKYENGANIIYIGRTIPGVIELNVEKESGATVDLAIRNGGDKWNIEGISFGAGSEPQYDVIFALIDDVVEETSRQQIKDMLTERNEIMTKDYAVGVGITQAAKDWRASHDQTTIRFGNVNLTWSNVTDTFTLKSASN